jgi:CRISPR-associated endonuclease Cas1
MNPVFFQQVESILSPERLDAYRQDGAAPAITLARYLWNMALCEALYSPLQIAEIALRNALHGCLSTRFGGAGWYDVIASLPVWQQRQLSEARQKLLAERKLVTPGRMVAELHFGFWTGFFNKSHAGTGLGHALARLAFAHAPRPERDLKKLDARWKRIRDLRNRIFHHERIIHWKDLGAQHSSIVAAAQDMSVTTAALRRMAELNVLLLVCNEKFEPCAITLPYYRPTNTELLRRQIEWTPEWKTAMWRQIITAKVRNQAANLAHLKRAHLVLTEIANRCEKPHPVGATLQSAADEEVRRSSEAPLRPSLATLTASKRAAFLSDSPDACESRAARHYWKHLLPRLSEWQKTDEKRRIPGTRECVNGMLDYGYSILRTAVLRSLAAYGFIAAIGIAHAPKAGSFALADDLMEPLRPWIDQELRLFLQGGERPMQEWMRQAVTVLQAEIKIGQAKVRLLNAVDIYVQSFAVAALARAPFPLRIPMLP